MGNVRHPKLPYSNAICGNPQLTHSTADPLPHRPHPNNRPRKDLRLLLPSPKTQGHRCLHRWNPTHSPPLAANRVHNRVVRSLHPLRRLPDHNWPVRGEYPRRGTIYSKGSGDAGGWKKECGVACIGRGLTVRFSVEGIGVDG